jgi:hypothetical protein
MTWSRAIGLTAFVVASLGAGSAVRADGYPPYFGYSPYFGGPTTYFTPEDTIHEVTKPADGGEFGFGTRTYYRGGPFWAYQETPRRRIAPARYSNRHARRVVRKD